MNTSAILILASLRHSSHKFSPAQSKAARRIFSALTARVVSLGREVLPNHVFLAVPADEQADFEQQDVRLLVQDGMTFGDRLHRCVEQVFQLGYDRVIILGNDCPQLDARLLREALARFETASAVLGPDHQGGAYLIGITPEALPTLAKIRWNANTDFHQLTSELRRRSVSFAILAKCYDVDNNQDLKRILLDPQVAERCPLRPLLLALIAGQSTSCTNRGLVRVVLSFLKQTQIINQLPPPLFIDCH